MAPHAALEETGASFEIRRVERSERGQSPPEYLAVKPLGRVPAYVEGMHFAYPERIVGDESQEAVRVGARRHLHAAFDHIDEELGDGPYLFGDRFSAADLYLHMVTRWCRRLPRSAWSLPNVGPHYERLSARPSVERMLAAQGIVAYPDDF